MRILTLNLMLFLFIHLNVSAQRRVTKPAPKPQVKTTAPQYPKRTTLALGAGLTKSVLYLSRNVKQNNDAKGLNLSLVYGGARAARVGLEYTYYWPIDITPTWYDVKAYTLELNMHVLARFQSKKAYFYPLFGLSYNVFSGTYTGINDYLNLRSLYKPNTHVSTRWLGFNAGTGFEYFFRPGSFFMEYKMRVGKTEGVKQINIQDVCISAGLRLNLRAPSIYSIFVYRGVRSRYLLDKEEAD